MVMGDFCQFCQFVKEPFSEKRLAVTLSQRQMAASGKFGMAGAAVAHHRFYREWHDAADHPTGTLRPHI
jgi:hypothetical protein